MLWAISIRFFVLGVRSSVASPRSFLAVGFSLPPLARCSVYSVQSYSVQFAVFSLRCSVYGVQSPFKNQKSTIVNR